MTRPSKTARKREQQSLQQLGEALVELDEREIAQLELDERLVAAVGELRRIRSHEAIRRQKQYIGKLMRGVDTDPIEQYFAAREARDRQQKRLFARAESWRDRLLADNGLLAEFAAETGQLPDALSDLLADHGTARSDRQERSLRREIFREIHRALEAQAAAG